MLKKKKKAKAIVLVSGGLDSALVLTILKNLELDLLAVNFTFPSLIHEKTKSFAQKVAQKLKIPYRSIILKEDYLKIVRNPRHGHGKGVNPCIDCKIYFLKKARSIMKQIKADFIATGEVLGQRPMSQHLSALQRIEKEAALAGKILRPLSARLLPETEAEKKGLVDRSQLLAIKGRGRRGQLELAQLYGLTEFSSPAGGCFLTNKEFAKKMRDLMKFKKKISWQNVLLLRIGRHFRYKGNKIIVGRNEQENNLLLKNRNKSDGVFEVKNHVGPITILERRPAQAAVAFAAGLTALYSDYKGEDALVKYNKKIIKVRPLLKVEADKFNLALL